MTPIVIQDEQGAGRVPLHPVLGQCPRPPHRVEQDRLANAPVGTGKSRLLDDLLDHYIAQSTFDLIVVLAALTVNLLERRLVRNPTPEVRRLRPRPGSDCGPLDPAWRAHERSGTTAYAKQHLCRSCPHFGNCFWPGQYGPALKGARIIFGTHQHLLVNPRFLLHLRSTTGAENVLLLLDEADLLAAPFRTTLSAEDTDAVRHGGPQRSSPGGGSPPLGGADHAVGRRNDL